MLEDITVIELYLLFKNFESFIIERDYSIKISELAMLS
jgi:hypothetical protein